MKINKTLEKQNKDGSFSINEKASPLYSAFILYLLNKNNSDNEIREKIVDFLLKEKSENWTFNYWGRGNKEINELLPDDLFTSALAWIALYEYNPEIFSPEDFAEITETLTFLEINEGGPYRNWLVPENSNAKWLDIKFASNFLLAEFLKLLDIELENLDSYLNEERFLAQEYLSENLINFFQKEKITNTEYFWQFPNNEKFIIDLDLENIDFNKKEKHSLISETEKSITKKIENNIRERLNIAGEEIRNAIHPILEYILNKEKAVLEILLLPYFFAQSFNKNFPDELLIKLGSANLWGWLAYTIYDDFLDDEGKKVQLSAANLALRELSQIFNNLENEYPGKNILENFHQAMDTVDRANTWEVENCRVEIINNEFTIPEKLPDYQDFQNLHERSIGHGLGPFTLSLIADFKKKSEKYKNLYQFIKSYIIAKQLNDDLNDFWDDLKRGQLNSIVTAVLIKWKEKYPNNKTIQVENDTEKIMNLLKAELLEEIIGIIIAESQKAKNALQNFQEKKNPILSKLIENIEESAKNTLKAEKENKEFIKHYQK